MNEFYFDEDLIKNGLIESNDVQGFNNDEIESIDLYGPYNGFIYGNLFKDLYLPYKDYKPDDLIPNDEYEEDLLNLNQIQFACHEINLFLDNYPEDINVIHIYNNYRQNFIDLLQKFETKYGPINVLSNNMSIDFWSWNSEPWPWEGNEY